MNDSDMDQKDTASTRLAKLEDESFFVDESPSKFFQGVFTILNSLKLPSLVSVFKNLVKVFIVTIIFAILFSIIDSFISPIAKFLTNG